MGPETRGYLKDLRDERDVVERDPQVGQHRSGSRRRCRCPVKFPSPIYGTLAPRDTVASLFIVPANQGTIGRNRGHVEELSAVASAARRPPTGRACTYMYLDSPEAENGDGCLDVTKVLSAGCGRGRGGVGSGRGCHRSREDYPRLLNKGPHRPGRFARLEAGLRPQDPRGHRRLRRVPVRRGVRLPGPSQRRRWPPSATCSPTAAPALAKACRCEKTYPSLRGAGQGRLRSRPCSWPPTRPATPGTASRCSSTASTWPAPCRPCSARSRRPTSCSRRSRRAAGST